MPLLIETFERVSAHDVRLALVEVIAQSRSETAVPFLASLLNDRRPEIWKAALDGLVLVGGTGARQTLSAYRSAALPQQLEWIDEAIDQVPWRSDQR